MLATELRDRLYQEALKGRRPQVVILPAEEFKTFVADLVGKRDVFDPIVFQGVMIATPEMTLVL